MQPKTIMKIISLCAGAGLGELGSKPFFETVLAVDSWWRACCSFKANHPETDVRCADIGDELLVEWAKNTYSSVDGIIASTPCPTFSKANSAGVANLATDPRSMIYLAPLKWVEAFRPSFFIAENVDNIVSSPYLGLMIASLNRLGYKTVCWSLDAADYGTPQHRARLFLITVRNDLPMPKVPIATHGTSDSGLTPYRTMGDAIGHLSEEEALSMGCEKLSAFRQWIMATVPPGQNWKSLKGERLAAALRSARSGRMCKRTCSRNDPARPSDTLLTGPSCLKTNSAIHPGVKIDKREFGRYDMNDVADTLSCTPRDNFKRIHPGEKESINNECFARLDGVTPSPTLTAGVNKQRRLYCHPSITRPLSVLEFMRIQGVEVPFHLFGARGDKYKMAGNGIPPQLMHKVCESVAEAIYARSGDDSNSCTPPDDQNQIAVPRPNLRYHGGKWRMAPWIISRLPEHEIYVEPFAGAASVLMRKVASRMEVVNDIDGDVVNLFNVLRDPTQAAELARLVSLTPYSRQEFEKAYEPTDDPLERARRLIVRSDMGFGCLKRSRNGFRSSLLHDMPAEWSSRGTAILRASERLKTVVIENMDALDCIRKYDSEKTLFYIDPPYVHSTRTTEKSVYVKELTDADHERLLETLHGVKGMVVVSGYDCELYQRCLKGWKRESIQNRNLRQEKTTETIWIKPSAA